MHFTSISSSSRPGLSDVARGSQQRVSVVTRAKPEQVKVGADGKASGFRFDPSMQRWIKSSNPNAAVDTVVKPLQGDPYTVWPVLHSELKAKNLKGVTPEEAAKMQTKGWTLVDVRLPADFDKQHADGALSIPLFRVVQGNEKWDIVKKIVMAGLAMTPTERDPDFIKNALTQVKKNQKIVVMCAIGGTLETKLNLRPDKRPGGIDDPDRSFGRESRSLKACHEFIYKGGWSANNVVFLLGGYQTWRHEGFPVDSS